MNQSSTHIEQRRRGGQAGPPLLVVLLVSIGLFAASLIAGTVVAGNHTYPSPFDSAPKIAAFFAGHTDAVQVTGLLQFASAVPLLIFTATVTVRLQHLGIRAPGALVTFAGGALASAFMMLSGMTNWTLSRLPVAQNGDLVRALHDVAFMTGGPAYTVSLGLLIAGVAVSTGITGLLPKWLAVVGVAIALVAQFGTLSLAFDGAAFLLPVARFPGLIWLITAAAMMPRTRPNAARSNLTAEQSS